jgi:hypothetical protein
MNARKATAWPDRRDVLTALGASTLVTTKSQAQSPVGYDYLFLDLSAGPRPAFVSHLKTVVKPLLDRAGGEVLGLFTPQLGWASTESALLIRWRGAMTGRAEALAAISRAPQVGSSRTDGLTPTLRPAASDRPGAGGIYVHRWFEVNSGSVAQFIELSGQGWKDFESRFATKIFGLFQTPRSAEDQRHGVTRLLLLTRYDSHAVWEASRDPTTEGMTIFQRRQQLTRGSKAASSLWTDPTA